MDISKLKQFTGVAVAIMVIAIWGETFVSSKILLERGLRPADIFLFRFSIAYVGMWFIAHKKLWADNLKDELTLMAMGVFGGSMYFLGENSALEYAPASNVAILVASTPLVTALLLSIFYKDERMKGYQVAGSLIAFIGMVMVVLNGELVLKLDPLGDVLALSASLAWGFYSLMFKRVVGRYESRFITRKVFAYGLLSIIPYFMVKGWPQIGDEVLGQPVVWGTLLYLGLVASLGCYMAWNWTLKRLGTVRATNILYLQSFFTMIIGYVVLSERITLMAACGALLLILGTARAVGRKA